MCCSVHITTRTSSIAALMRGHHEQGKELLLCTIQQKWLAFLGTRGMVWVPGKISEPLPSHYCQRKGEEANTGTILFGLTQCCYKKRACYNILQTALHMYYTYGYTHIVVYMVHIHTQTVPQLKELRRRKKPHAVFQCMLLAYSQLAKFHTESV